MAIPPQLHQPLRLLIRANHILHNHNLVDAFGHISIRHPLNPSQYIIAAYDPGAPALVKSLNDFIAYKVSDSSPVDQNSPQGYSERFIHGEIFRRYPEAKCVVHSHSEVVVPFSLGDVDVKPVFHMAGFLGADAVPVFYAEDLYAKAEKGTFQADMLIKTQALGEALAMCFDKSSPVVLQHKHGFTTWGRSVEEAVYRAIYTQMNCKLLTQAIGFAGGDAAKVAYLSAEEARACKAMNEKCVDKCWRLWVREVQVNPLYVTEEGEPDSVKVAGMNLRKDRKSAAQDRVPSKVEKLETSQAEEPKQKPFQIAETQITEKFKDENSEIAYVQRAGKPTPAELGEIAIQQFERPLKGYCVDCGVEVR